MMQGIILAAGLGSRLHEITKNTPKSLIEVNAQPILERNIEFMIEAGFERIVIVVGYMKERFEYLKQKYSDFNLILVYNNDYATSNTVSSLYRALPYLDCETYITTADIYLRINPFNKYTENRNFYLLRPKAVFEKADWIAYLNTDNRIEEVDQHAFQGHSYTGISHWMPDGLQLIKDRLCKINWENENERKQYWDELVLPYLSTFCLYAKILEDDTEIYEFDDIFDVNLLVKEQQIHVKY